MSGSFQPEFFAGEHGTFRSRRIVAAIKLDMEESCLDDRAALRQKSGNETCLAQGIEGAIDA